MLYKCLKQTLKEKKNFNKNYTYSNKITYFLSILLQRRRNRRSIIWSFDTEITVHCTFHEKICPYSKMLALPRWTRLLWDIHNNVRFIHCLQKQVFTIYPSGNPIFNASQRTLPQSYASDKYIDILYHSDKYWNVSAKRCAVIVQKTV